MTDWRWVGGKLVLVQHPKPLLLLFFLVFYFFTLFFLTFLLQRALQVALSHIFSIKNTLGIFYLIFHLFSDDFASTHSSGCLVAVFFNKSTSDFLTNGIRLSFPLVSVTCRPKNRSLHHRSLAPWLLPLCQARQRTPALSRAMRVWSALLPARRIPRVASA
jgi:hypothetical protein